MKDQQFETIFWAVCALALLLAWSALQEPQTGRPNNGPDTEQTPYGERQR